MLSVTPCNNKHEYQRVGRFQAGDGNNLIGATTYDYS